MIVTIMCTEHMVTLAGAPTWFKCKDEGKWAADTSNMSCPEEDYHATCNSSWRVIPV
jgi:hypothetical protein